MKKIGIVLLMLLLCLAAVSCGKKDAPPSGMQEAATEDAEYHLYVPESWVLNNRSGVSGAYAPTADRANVTVTSDLPDATITAESYFNDICLPRYESGTLSNFALVEDKCEDTTLGGLNAKKYVYVYDVGGDSFETMQVVLSTGNMVYNFTYTSDAAHYEDHLEEVSDMMSEFRFK